MTRKGVVYTVRLIEPGVWRWDFQIGGAVRTGKTRTNLMGMAIHRVHKHIDRMLRTSLLPPSQVS